MDALFYNNFDTAFIPHILKELYIENVYHKFFHGKKDMIVLDIGANIGLFSMYARKYAKKVYAVEPSSEHMKVLKRNIEHNKWDNVIPIEKALFFKNEKMRFYENEANATMSSLNSTFASDKEKYTTVDGIDLTTLLDSNNIKHVDFMKLDIEGAEGEVIGSKAFEEGCKRINSLVVEYHTWSGFNPTQLATTLHDYGYDVFVIPADAKLYGAIRK